MKFNLENEIAKFTGKLTTTVTAKAKDSAISTLKDPEFKATVNQFTREWFDEHSHIILPIFAAALVLSVLAVANIVSNFSAKR